MATDLLTVETTTDADLVEIRCTGELDTSTCGQLHDAITWSYSTTLRALRLDLDGVRFMDASGLACLLGAARDSEERGVCFEILASDAVTRIIDITDAWLPVMPPRPADPTTTTAP